MQLSGFINLQSTPLKYVGFLLILWQSSRLPFPDKHKMYLKANQYEFSLWNYVDHVVIRFTGGIIFILKISITVGCAEHFKIVISVFDYCCCKRRRYSWNRQRYCCYCCALFSGWGYIVSFIKTDGDISFCFLITNVLFSRAYISSWTLPICRHWFS